MCNDHQDRMKLTRVIYERSEWAHVRASRLVYIIIGGCTVRKTCYSGENR